MPNAFLSACTRGDVDTAKAGNIWWTRERSLLAFNTGARLLLARTGAGWKPMVFVLW